MNGVGGDSTDLYSWKEVQNSNLMLYDLKSIEN